MPRPNVLHSALFVPLLFTALRDAQDTIIGYLLIGTDNTARKQAEEALLKAGALQSVGRRFETRKNLVEVD